MKFEIEAEIPEGYEPTGEYRIIGVDEPFLNSATGIVSVGSETLSMCKRIILRKKRWIPVGGEVYFFISSDAVWNCKYYDTDTDEDRIKIGNCFKTEEEAKAKFEKFLEVLKEEYSS